MPVFELVTVGTWAIQDVAGCLKHGARGHLTTWAQTDVDSDQICKISSDDIFDGDIINSLTAFLKCDAVPGIHETQQQYQQLVREKYNQLF